MAGAFSSKDTHSENQAAEYRVDKSIDDHSLYLIRGMSLKLSVVAVN